MRLISIGNKTQERNMKCLLSNIILTKHAISLIIFFDAKIRNS